MSSSSSSRFAVVERDGYSEREIFEAPTIEEVEEFLSEKGGQK